MQRPCTVCGCTDRPIHGKGMCKRCHARDRYQNDSEYRARRLAKQKQTRLAMPPQKYDAYLTRVKQWGDRNKDKVRAHSRAWNQRNGKGPRLVPGTTVYLRWNGFWCEGTITEVSTPPRRRIVVTLKGGTIHTTIGRYLKLTHPERF